MKHGTFAGAGNPRAHLPRKNQDLIIEILSLIIIGLPSIYFLIQFLLYASMFSQMIFLLIIFAGKRKSLLIHSDPSFDLSGILAVRLMIQTSTRPKQD